MPSYRISAPDGRTYTIEGPAGATDDQVRAEVLRQHPDAAQTAAPKPAPKVSVPMDMLRSAGAGAAQTGVSSLGQTAMAAQAPQAIVQGVQRLAGRAASLITGRQTPAPLAGAPNVGQQAAALMQAHPQAVVDASPLGYTPQTTAGDYAKTAGEFLPAAFMPGTAIQRTLRVLLPSVSSETAGQVTKGTPFEPAARFAGGALGGVGVAASETPAMADLAGGVARTAGRAAGIRTPPDVVAINKISQALQEDGANPAQIFAAISDYAKNGSSAPALLDVAGENTRALIRAAAARPGPGRQAVQTYVAGVKGEFQPNTVRATQALTPGSTESAASVQARLQQGRDATAAVQYRAPYNEAVDAAPVVDALTGKAGAQAIGTAQTEADAMRLAPQQRELTALKAAANPVADEPLPASLTPEEQQWAKSILGGGEMPKEGVNASLGTLDRIKIAFNQMGQSAADKGQGGLASGYFDRAKQIDNHLAEQSPAYAAARDNYANGSTQMEKAALGPQLGTAPSMRSGWADGVESAVSNLGPTRDLQISARSRLEDWLSSSKDRSPNAADNIANTPTTVANILKIFGQGAGSRYVGRLNDEIGRVGNANFISPNAGSKTANALMDQDMLDPADVGRTAATVGGLAHGNFLPGILQALDKARRGAMLTPEESAAIVNLGTDDATRGLAALDARLSASSARSAALSRSPMLPQVLLAGTLGAQSAPAN